VPRAARHEPADHALVALNAALMADGIVLEIAPGVPLAEPLELLCLTLPGDAPIMAHTRHLVALGSGAEATLIERHLALGAGEYLANGATAIEVGAGATLRHYKLQDEGPVADHFHTSWVETAADAVYDSIVMTVGARLSRNQIRARVNGSGARIRLDGTYMLRDRQHADHTTLIDHAAPSAESRQVYKGAIDERARGVFQGQIVVRQEAQKTDGHQLNRALLLSDEAEIDAKPNLEIYADDVKCSHGATAGDLDEDALFYLRARGIDIETARGLLIAAFLDEVVGDVEDAATRALFEARVERWVAERGSGR
jgi:Fe-S cluster assembly protein SufD